MKRNSFYPLSRSLLSLAKLWHHCFAHELRYSIDRPVRAAYRSLELQKDISDLPVVVRWDLQVIRPSMNVLVAIKIDIDR